MFLHEPTVAISCYGQHPKKGTDLFLRQQVTHVEIIAIEIQDERNWFACSGEENIGQGRM